MRDELIADLEHEAGQLDRILQAASRQLEKTDWSEEQAALAAIQLHSFYNGAEKCMVWLHKADGAPALEGDRWHRDLLQTFAGDPSFPASGMRELMAFRHVFRHSYSFELRPNLVRERAESLSLDGSAFLEWLRRRTDELRS